MWRKTEGCGLDEIKIGEIKWGYNGLGMIWLRCSLVAANKISRDGRIRIGWTMARVELLEKRPLQCFRCWEFGHVQFSCRAKVNRKGRCYKCGELDHSANLCEKQEPKCILCEEKGHPANHRIGSRFCKVEKVQVTNKQLPRRRMAGSQVDERTPRDKGNAGTVTAVTRTTTIATTTTATTSFIRSEDKDNDETEDMDIT